MKAITIRALPFFGSLLAISLLIVVSLMPSPARSEPRSWTGPYAGLAAGYTVSNSETSLDVTGLGSVATVDGFGAEGGSLTGLAGFDFQLHRFVVGGRLEYTWGDADTTINLSLPPIIAGTVATMGFEDRYAFILRGGYLFTDDVLGYVLAGYTHAEVTDLSSPLANVTFSASDTDGWVAGLGAEWRLYESLFLQLEGTYTKLDDVNVSLAPALTGASINVEPHLLGARAGIVYRHDWLSGAD